MVGAHVIQTHKNLPTTNKIINSNNLIVSHMLNEVKNLVWNTITSNGYLGKHVLVSATITW